MISIIFEYCSPSPIITNLMSGLDCIISLKHFIKKIKFFCLVNLPIEM